MAAFGRTVEQLLTSLTLDVTLPDGFSVLDPYRSDDVRSVIHQFCATYYTGTHARLSVWGINPGRFGAGVTGLSFTDPYALTHQLGLQSTLTGRREPSAEFISSVIDAYGGPIVFYRDIFMSALSPLGFVKDGKNINFYDDARLKVDIVPFVLDSMRTMIKAGLRTDATVLLGSGALKTFFEKHIRPHIHFDTVVYLDHPRYVMQYRRREMERYVQEYVRTLQRFTTEP
jgi:hypothetical protein